MPRRPKLWITYAWSDNDEGDFDYLVQELEEAGAETTFDRVALVAGRRLWEQIADRIEDPELDGWAILLTQASISSAACQEELAYALERALNTKGEAFPLLGLVDNVPIAELPASLRTRLMVKLRDPEWPELVVSALSAKLKKSGSSTWELGSQPRQQVGATSCLRRRYRSSLPSQRWILCRAK